MREAWRRRPISTFFATGGGIGMIPWAPGTWGSVEGLAVDWLLARKATHDFFIFTGSNPGLIVGAGILPAILLTAFLSMYGIYWSGRVEQVCVVRDPGQVVIDEVAGQLLASLPCLMMGIRSPLWLWLLSFAFFRLFDIWKPGPIRKLQELPGGWGIMLDDVAAGILAGVLTYGVGRIW